jgi:hypothetical protein
MIEVSDMHLALIAVPVATGTPLRDRDWLRIEACDGDEHECSDQRRSHLRRSNASSIC